MSEEAFVRRFHRAHPGSTAAALARGVVEGTNASSYDLLAAAVVLESGTDRVAVDLGCGDGWLIERMIARGWSAGRLIGIDVSDDELRLAKARVPDATWVQGRAQALPLADASCAAVVSHLAWTLMPDVEAIVDELRRVLVEGGRFVTLVGGGPKGDDAFAGLLDLATPFARAAPATPRLGDRRARTDAGLQQLFARGFALAPIEDVAIDLSGSIDEVWASLATSYELANLAPDTRAALHARFVDEAPRWRRDDGKIAATMYGRMVTAIRTGAR